MYSIRHNLTIGFHGCDKEVAIKVVNNENLKHSNNPYDWLGHGFYFWEQNPKRAFDFAEAAHKKPELSKGVISTPYVLGAVIELGNCLDLLEANSLRVLKTGYATLLESKKGANANIQENKPADGEDQDFILRLLDCAVIETIHQMNRETESTQYDSVRAAFIQGDRIYPNAGFSERNHIQICIRNINCIKGFFLLREEEVDGFKHFNE